MPNNGENTASNSSVVIKKTASEKKNKNIFQRIVSWWKMRTYITRMTMAFAFIAAMTALVAIGVLSFVWQQHFRTYTEENMRSLAQSTANRIEEVYESTHSLKNQQVVAVAKYAESLNSGVGIAVIDNNTGMSIYDSSAVSIDEQDGKSSDSTSSYSSGYYRSLAPTPSQANTFTSDTIEYNGKVVGTVRVWVYGSESLLTQADEEFANNSYQAMVFATFVAILLACCIGFLFARALVRPVNKIMRTTTAIKNGDLMARTGMQGSDEISRLGATFDQMADSVERDREIERRLTSDVAHELRTPLMAIQSTVEAMIDGVYETSTKRLETVNSEVMRLSRLVDAILKLSRLENRSNPLNKTTFDVGELISSIVSTHEAYVHESGLKLIYEFEQGVLVYADSDMIRQATANFISNAVRYTPEGGTITVKVFSKDNMAHIAVQDTGIGLSKDEIKMVFNRFWRAEEGRTRAKGGLGVGLSVVKEIVDRHDGQVSVEGEKGKGSCFTIMLPLLGEGADDKKQA